MSDLFRACITLPDAWKTALRPQSRPWTSVEALHGEQWKLRTRPEIHPYAFEKGHWLMPPGATPDPFNGWVFGAWLTLGQGGFAHAPVEGHWASIISIRKPSIAEALCAFDLEAEIEPVQPSTRDSMIFMGNGPGSVRELEALHRLIEEAARVVSGMNQNGGMGSAFDYDSDRKDRERLAEIRAVLKSSFKPTDPPVRSVPLPRSLDTGDLRGDDGLEDTISRLLDD